MKEDVNIKIINTLAPCQCDSRTSLDYICQITNSVRTKWSDAHGSERQGYKVPGKLRTYFVDEVDLRVFDHDSKVVFCIASKAGQPLTGKPGLIARIQALHNDQDTAKQVSVLAP